MIEGGRQMKSRIVALSLTCLLSACASHVPAPASTGDNDIRNVVAGEKWSLAETADSGTPVRKLQLEFTDEAGDACIGGNWKRVRVLSDPSRYAKDPVYDSSGDGLQILLVNGICDSYDSYFFRGNDAVGQGTHDHYGWSATRTIGSVSAERIR
jgi:hypothetical protein